MKHIWLYITQSDIDTELKQCEEEGRDVSSLRAEFARIGALDLEDPRNQPAAEALLDASIALPAVPGYAYIEPSGLDEIRRARPAGAALPALGLSRSALTDRVYGAWAGRCAGCLLGKPVEGWRRPRMWGYLNDTGRWPLSDYFRYDAASSEVAKRYDLRPEAPFGDRVDAMPEDDDTNYTTTGLAIMKRYGPGFTPEQVAEFWMSDIPILHVCTAERVAYRNFCLLVPPPASASFRNPYREWIGAQIRADFWGYAAPGDPALAAELAWRDACISHVKNGIYGEMWAAAMVAAAFCVSTPRAAIEAGLAQIPERCRLAEDIHLVLGWHDQGVGYDDAVERIHAKWNEGSAHAWCHTISNAMIVAAGLLWGDGDFGRSICRGVQCCFDTDCNGATIGSVMGALQGRSALPGAWVDLMNDTLRTGVAGYHEVKLQTVVSDTLDVIDKVAASR